jgi:hypothetical protein
MDALGAMFSSGLAAYLVYGLRLSSASKVGFSLNMAVAFSAMILWFVRFICHIHPTHAIYNFLSRMRRWVRVLNEFVRVSSWSYFLSLTLSCM